MKKTLALMVVLVFLLSANLAYGASDNLWDGMVQKFWIGLVNTFTGWVELPAQTLKGYNDGFGGDESNKVIGVIGGVVEGLYHSVGRTVSGVADMTTFWAADPVDYEGVGIPLDAEYAWEEGEGYEYFSPDVSEATLKPMGNKLIRGLGNGLLGVIEIPGQIMKGAQEGAYDLGIVKGIWYFLSREAHGAKDFATFFLPNPSETKALAFDEEYPWEALTDRME
ncbi:MAG: hypothetical protein JW800_07095 [Candidatus Omnitrophica bacterium]|nr:hypothetical protein [Candidatus Omnitrophota bacterium]